MREHGEPPAPSGYTPRLPAAEIERVRRWHEDAYRFRKALGEQTTDYLGLTLVVPPEVQPITPVSFLLGEAVLAEVREEDRVLDMGTGSGVNAILAARTAAEVVAVDINPHALEAARRNAERNGVAERVEVRHSDVFAAVDGRFDLIVFDPPFRWFAPRDLAERATTDENYRAMTEFFRQARRRLTDRGRMLVFFGSTGDLAYLTRLADEEGFGREVVARLDATRDDWPVEYLTFRLTP
ncbi:methyltransferase [Streptoalloteichus hindustanus]|uniref:Release factor glutamine methyltransferase n=1 Tax=Streptoalloteichus hindustanus TaxID=2017 RepID=A0A1M4XQC1_STRHI|nr:methyltransferase [Streptoalloteichus hindustanus]SHE95787.1 release factor glutamine methyltransferase [Streptoalloteichus hindustanus]